MKSGSLRFEFEVKVKRNILVLFYHTELIIVSVLKTSKNLEGTCHLLLCWGFGGTCLSASVRTCLSASEFSVYFYYYYIWYCTLLVLTFETTCLSASEFSVYVWYFYYFIQNIGMYVCTVLTDPFPTSIFCLWFQHTSPPLLNFHLSPLR